MADFADNRGGGAGNRWRILGWGLAAALLALPAVAMQFTPEVVWTASDFVLMGLLLALVGGAFELAVRMSSSRPFRAGAAVAILTAFLTIWVNLAVGMIGDDNPYNLVFAGVVALALAGAIVARSRPEGMVRAMIVAAVAQVLAGAGGLSADLPGGLLSMGFALFWLVAAALFRKAAREEGSAGAA